MPLALVLGPANCGKIGYLRARFLEFVDAGADPFLIVPRRGDVATFEREILTGRGALIGGWVGTFDSLFDQVLDRCGEHGARISEVQRVLILQRIAAAAQLDAVATSARFSGFAAALAGMIDELSAGMVDPPAGQGADGELLKLAAAYREECRRLNLHEDRMGQHARAVALLENRLDAWDGRPVLAYGFEHMTAAQVRPCRRSRRAAR